MASFSKEIFNYREELVSSDLVRAQNLLSKEAQDVLRDHGRSSIPNSLLSIGAPRTGADKLPTFVPAAGTRVVSIGAGQAFLDDPAITGDDSTYQVVRWATQDLTFEVSAATPRIDVVYATPGELDSDSASRNILVDPTSRTILPTAVNKTRNPLATLSIDKGAFGASPVPNAVLAGKIALFEVHIPVTPGGDDSSNYVVTRRLTRRVGYPVSAMHGILEGCVPQWTIVDETTTSSVMSLGSLNHRVVVDGQLLEWAGDIDFVDDTSAPPTMSTFSDKPFYVYLCGGAGNPLGGQASSTGAPVIAVRTSIAPYSDGTPIASLHTLRGVVTRYNAVYVTPGWIVANAAGRIKSCKLTGDQIAASAYSFNDSSDGATLNAGYLGVSGTPTAIVLYSRPSIANWVRIACSFDFITLPDSFFIFAMPGGMASAMSFVLLHVDAIADFTETLSTFETALWGIVSLAYTTASAPGVPILQLHALAYSTGVRRYSSF
jgi:hypothetical protein